MKKVKVEDLRVSQMITLSDALINGRFSISSDSRGGDGDPCANHGGIDWCEGSICACRDGHVVIRP